MAKIAALRLPHAFLLPFRNLFPSAIPIAWQVRWETIMTPAKMEEITDRVVCPWSNTHVRGHRSERVLDQSSEEPHVTHMVTSWLGEFGLTVMTAAALAGRVL